jgi:hypothetical protein
MPSRHYRRHLINNNKTHNYIHNKYLINHSINLQNDNNNNNDNNNKSLLHTIQQYFLDIIDAIILYSDMNIAIQQLHSLITLIKSKEDIYLLLDNIENTLLSIICNISDGVNVGIISDRIQYLRELLSKLPDDCTDYDYYGKYIFSIIDSITNSVDFNTVYSNIINIQSLIQNDLNQTLYNQLNLIQTTIISIICNISDGVNIGIISDRIQYLNTLINAISC